jgi:hypothetical protein
VATLPKHRQYCPIKKGEAILSSLRRDMMALDKHPLPANNFLFLPKVDTHIEDLVNDQKTHSSSLNSRTRLSNMYGQKKSLSPLSEIWDELDGAPRRGQVLIRKHRIDRENHDDNTS